ncbi:MAG: imidazole glycerol phosphate synthase subunit HisH [Cytophagales bacterium]|nr:imidazole glycerol phosphate synthase subunit HisH [Cytophagales bacterium]
MNPRVTVIDYGINNLLSICRALEHCGATVSVAARADQLKSSDRLVLPGVGAFPDGMKELNQRGLSSGIRKFYATGKPLLGICLGMQLLMKVGTEISETPGIGILEGKVLRLPENALSDGNAVKIPHMNWNKVIKPDGVDWGDTMLHYTTEFDYLYFVHSYYVAPDNASEIMGLTSFGDFKFASVLNKQNCWATQFHPEKSGAKGLKILEKFLNG